MSVEWLATFAEAARAKENDRNGWPARKIVTAIALNPSATHVGVAWRADDGWRFLSLVGDRELKNNALRNGDWCVSPAVAPELLTLVSEMCRRVLDRNELYAIRFGFRFDSTRFNDDGEYVLGENEVGLTCATFVLALFRSAGVELLRVREWPTRPDDEVRHNELIDSFASDRGDIEHINALQREVGVVRFRPEEVAAASAVPPHPCSFTDASQAGVALLAAVRQRGAAPAAPSAPPVAAPAAPRPKKRRQPPL
jgi:hypothetical protein